MADFKEIQIGEDGQVYQVKDETARNNAGSGDGTVTGVKVGSTPYDPDNNGVVDLSTPFNAKVDKVDGKGLSTNDYTTAEKAKLQNLPTADQLTQQLSTKANSSEVVKSISVNGQTQSKDSNGNVNIQVEGGAVESVTLNGTNHEPNSQGIVDLGTIQDGITPHIGQDGYWYIGTTNTGVKAQGERGNDGVSNADECVVVNNLDGEPADLEEGQVAVLGAEMGKILSEMIEEGGETIDISYNSSRKAIVITTASAPLVKASTPSRASLSCRAGSTDSVTFMVRGKRLMQPIAISVSDSINWQVSPAQVSPTQDGDVALTTITVTYRPASGSATGTQHSCVVTISYNNETQSTISLQGEVLAAPTINMPSSLTINKYEGDSGSSILHVSGVGLEGDVSLVLSGAGFSFNDSSSQTTLTVSRADAIAGADVPVYFTGNADANGTVTASSAAATDVVTNLVGHIAVPAALDTEFTYNGLKYKVKTVASQNTHGKLKLINPAGESSTSTSTYSGAISIPATIEKDGFVYDVTSIGSNAFYRATGVTSVVVGDNVTNIGYQAFADCSNMTSISIGNGVTTISDNAFQSCTKLANITIGNSVTTIGARAFSMAAVSGGSLQSITLPDSVTSLGDYVFSGCTKLTTVKIGTTTGCQMSSISSAFYNCSAIVKVTCYATSVPSISATADNFMPASARTTATLEVPSASKSSYEGDSKWGTFGNITAITE